MSIITESQSQLQLQQKETEHGNFYYVEYDDKSWVTLNWAELIFITVQLSYQRYCKTIFIIWSIKCEKTSLILMLARKLLLVGIAKKSL